MLLINKLKQQLGNKNCKKEGLEIKEKDIVDNESGFILLLY